MSSTVNNVRGTRQHGGFKAAPTANRQPALKAPTLGDENQVSSPQQHQVSERPQIGTGRGGALAVRLEMNLHVDIQLKAKIKGVITLAILDGNPTQQ